MKNQQPVSAPASSSVPQSALGPRKNVVQQPQIKAAEQTLELADIHIPAKPSAWPPALGWWILLALLITLLTVLVIKFIRYKKLKKQQQRILQALAKLEGKLRKDRNTVALAEINILLRRLALMRYPRKQIASLTGKNWIDFLDNSGNTQDFSKGAGRVLADVPYLAQMPEKIDIKELSRVVKKWVKHISAKEHKAEVMT